LNPGLELESLKTRRLAARLKSWRWHHAAFAPSPIHLNFVLSFLVPSQIEFTTTFQVFQRIEENSI